MQRARAYATAVADARPLKLAIVGAGPSGFYTASRVLASLQQDNVEVHMYERLPTPYGLVRYGVAPDHPEVKNCQHKFDELAADRRFRFFGNVCIGSPPSRGYTYPHALSLPFASLQAHYNTILLTYGSSTSASLGIPGSSSSPEALENIHPALDFVSWYNGHPAYASLAPNIDHLSKATVIGHGNVALDCARILLKSPDELRGTDIPLPVLDVLAASKIRHVEVVGRRGPGQVAFTTKEFRELLALPDVEFGKVDSELLLQAKELVGKDRMKNRLLALMEKGNAAATPHGSSSKHVELGFLRSPLEFQPSVFSPMARKVGNIQWSHNTLLAPPPETPTPPTNSPAATSASTRQVVAHPTNETSVTRTDFVIESVGYKSEPLSAEVPFDTGRGRVRNVDGRVVDSTGVVIPGLYAAGWAARGPVGVIASTMHDAYALASTIITDHASLPASRTEGGVPDELSTHRDMVVGLDEWKRIDEAEVKRAGPGRVREKFLSVEDMLGVLH